MTVPMVKFNFWLRLDGSGHVPSISKNPPGVGVGERAMQCQLSIPKSVFQQPQLVANIEVQHEQKDTVVIDIEAAETALSGVVGCDVMMDVIYPTDEESNA